MKLTALNSGRCRPCFSRPWLSHWILQRSRSSGWWASTIRELHGSRRPRALFMQFPLKVNAPGLTISWICVKLNNLVRMIRKERERHMELGALRSPMPSLGPNLTARRDRSRYYAHASGRSLRWASFQASHPLKQPFWRCSSVGALSHSVPPRTQTHTLFPSIFAIFLSLSRRASNIQGSARGWRRQLHGSPQRRRWLVQSAVERDKGRARPTGWTGFSLSYIQVILTGWETRRCSSGNDPLSEIKQTLSVGSQFRSERWAQMRLRKGEISKFKRNPAASREVVKTLRRANGTSLSLSCRPLVLYRQSECPLTNVAGELERERASKDSKFWFIMAT